MRDIIGKWGSEKNPKVPPSHHYIITAATVSSDPGKYTKAILGKENSEYVKWIQLESSWGGAIEAQIMAEYFGIVVTVVDTKVQEKASPPSF